MCSRTAVLDDFPPALTCWRDTIAVGLESGSIIILDGITGSQAAILSGHSDFVTSLTFSSDGTSLASGSYDETIKLWDMQTGGVVKTFRRHSRVLSISFSIDHTMIASGFHDRTIWLWDIQTEGCLCVMQLQDRVDCVRFSPIDHQCLMSASGGKVQQWDTSGQQIGPTYNGFDVAFSPDGSQFVSCHREDVVVQNVSSGAVVIKFYIAKSNTSSCCFSPDGKHIAAAADNTVYVWNITSSEPHPTNTLVGHTGYISSLAFSSPSSLISSSEDRSVKFWQVGPPPMVPAVINPESAPLSLAPINSITLQTKDGIAISSHSDGVVKTWDILTGLCKASFQTPAKATDNSDVRLINSRLILIWYVVGEGRIHIWDVGLGELQTVDVKRSVEDIRISEDGSKVLFLYKQFIQARSIQTGEVMCEVNYNPLPLQRPLTVDGSRVWVHSPLSELGRFDISPSLFPVRLSNMPPSLLCGTKLWDVGISGIKDMATGKVVFQLGGRFSKPRDAHWDGQYLVAGYSSGEMLIVDFNHILTSRNM